MVTAFGRGAFLGGHDFKNDEILLVFFILFLWGVVLSIFFQRWGENPHARRDTWNLYQFREDPEPSSLPASLQQGDGRDNRAERDGEEHEKQSFIIQLLPTGLGQQCEGENYLTETI